MTDEVKLCSMCKHSKIVYEIGQGILIDCHAPQNMRRSLVTGRDAAKNSCEWLRDDESKCGTDGRWFEARRP